MGYYTHFEFDAPVAFVEHYKRNEEELDDLLGGYSFYWGGGDQPNTFISEESYKFYDWEIAFSKLSKLYPDDVFTVRGNGEESGDMWVAYFKNGKVQHCKARITYDDFDESKLTSLVET